MTINNFPELLDRSLKGESKALIQWFDYQSKRLFSSEQIEEAIVVLISVIGQSPHPQKSNALLLLGRIYAYSITGIANYNHETISFIDQSIALNNDFAMNFRAKMHEKGLGGPINYPEAIRLYNKAIALGNLFAMANRAYMHEKGLGGAVNYTAAAGLYEQAIALGNDVAANNLGYMHENGLGGPVNYSEAVRLYKQAIAAGIAEAANNLDVMEKKFAPVRKQQQRVNALITQLQYIQDNLQSKKAQNPDQYRTVLDAAIALKTTVSEQSELFFNSPTQMQLDKFRVVCKAALFKAEDEFKNHRGVWHQIHPIIKGIIGILATLAVIPAMGIYIASKHGYIDTFFSTPKTQTQEQLDAVTIGFNKVENDIFYALPNKK